MLDVRHFLRVTIFWTLTVVFSTLTIIKVAISWFKQRGNYFYTLEHPKPTSLREFKDGFFQLSDIRLHYTEAGDPLSPTTLLFIHGFPQFHYCWRYQLRHFKETHHVIALDMRGYNESEKPVGIKHYRIEKLVNDLAEVIDQLGGRVVLCGHDWGGVICWLLASSSQAAIEKLIILNAPEPRAFEQIISTNSRQLLASSYMFMFQTPYLAESVFRAQDFRMLTGIFKRSIKNPDNFTSEDEEAYKYAFAKPYGLSGPLNYYRAAPDYMHDLHRRTELMGLIKPKTLIIHGELDTAITTACAHASLRFCADGELKLISNASHFVQEDEPAAVNKLIEEFLAKA